MTVSEIKELLSSSSYDEKLKSLYVTEDVKTQKLRILHIMDGFTEAFAERDITIFSAPGRTELGGNHTDHQHGKVLAASVNLDIIACAAKNESNVIRIISEGYPMDEIDLSVMSPQENEINHTAALIRGIVHIVKEMGYEISGFDAYMTSNVLGGSGLSSSAAYETMIGVIVNTFFCDGQLTAVDIAKNGQYAENVFFGKPCGLMDQMASSVGNVVAIDFADEEEPVIEEIKFPFTQCGHSLCIVDSGADHADLTDEYAAVPSEMKEVAKFFGKTVLHEVSENDFWENIAGIRKACGDRAVLRAGHFFEESKRAAEEAEALKVNDFQRFLKLVKESGRSSFMYLQNVYPSGYTSQQAVAVSLFLAEKLLKGKGAVRVHGGGFAGTIQAFVPNDMLNEFKDGMEKVLGEDSCHVLGIRPAGGIVLM